MKYTSPLYKNEVIESCDIICESIVKIAYVDTVITDENGNQQTVTATQVSVDISHLF